LVGEMRDLETTSAGITAAETGHLVLSTLHTNDAPSAITRLIDMGVKPFLVASSIQAIMAQRLVRVICPDCKEVYPDPDPHILTMLGFTEDEIDSTTFYRGAGCGSCNGTGYKGRLAIFELMEMNSVLRELAFNREPLSEIRRAAKASGMRPLAEDGRMKIRNGVTTPDDLFRITQASEVIVE
ncbi:MAG: Flp pilus assembly complex ATPase component TadA, partial [Phycisphaerae bacterium]|nr:Flp pilus assembly complex ATPase component TadA [Phycisphaerae bacterium]